MKTDYAALGTHALQVLRQTTADARQIQRQQLESILRRNEATAYGRRCSFSKVDSLESFQAQVPLTSYGDYQPYIERQLAGTPNQLTADPPVYYAITSGSTGQPKYVPVTRADMEVHYHAIYGGVFGMVQEYYPHLPPEALFGNILETGEFARTSLPDGTMCGIRSASLYQWLDRHGEFDASDYCVPKEVLFPDTLQDMTYIRARFALAARDITAIHSVFLHRVEHFLDYITENWELLLRDMERGCVDQRVTLAESWRQKLSRWLPPDPKRAAELRSLAVPQHPEEMVQRIWPGVRYLVGIGGRNFPLHTRRVQHRAAGIPIHHFIYGASEGFLSIAAGVDVPDAYILLPQAGFFEFLPVSGGRGSGDALAIGELERGGRYELVFTNHSGLYRYRMQDVLEVVDFFGQAPVVRFCYRINQALNVADEKMNTEQLQAALAEFRQRADDDGAQLCAQEDFTTHPGCYLFYMEGNPRPDLPGILEDCLCRASLGYRGCRSMAEIGPARIRLVPPGTFARYEELVAARSHGMAQYKPLQVLHQEWSRAFFAAQAERYKGMCTL